MKSTLHGLGSALRSIRNQVPVAYAPKLSLPWSKPDGAEAQMRAYGSVSTLFAIVHRTSNATSQVNWRLWRKAQNPSDRKEVTSHAALDVWNQPNKFMTRQELVEAGQQHIDLTGEGWIVVGRNPMARGIPLELWPVRPDRMAPVPSPTDYLSGYVYTGPNGEQVPLERDSVLMLRMPNPLDPYRGMGPVQAAMVDIDSAKYSAEWNRNFFLNSAEPGGIIQVDRRLSDDEFNELTARWREQHQGIAQAHRVAVIEQGTWVNKIYTQRDMQFVELRTLSRDELLAAFGMSKFALGVIDDVNRASGVAAADWFARYLTLPRLERWKGMLNNDFLPLFGNTAAGLEFDYDSPIPDDPERENAERLNKAQAAKIYIEASFDPPSVQKALDLPDGLQWKKPEPPPAPAAPSGAPGQPPADQAAQNAPPAQKGQPQASGGSFLDLVGRFRSRRGLVDRALNRTYHRDSDGQFASGDGGGGSGDHEIDSDPNVGQVDEGNFGYGRDPNGLSYTENDVDQETGAPKFSQAYRDKYGQIDSDNQIGSTSLRVVDTVSGGIHVADDRHGTMSREVVQEFTPRQAKSLGDDIYEVNTNGGSRTNKATGVSVEAQGGPNAEGYHATTVTFANGASAHLSADETFDLQESLDISGTSTRPSNVVAPPRRRRARVLNVDVSQIDLTKVQRDWERQLNALLRDFGPIVAAQRDQIISQVRSAIDANDLAALARLSPTVTDAVEALTAAMTEMALQAAKRLSSDTQEQQGVRIDPVASDSGLFTALAAATATLLGNAMANSAGREALRRWGFGNTGDEVASAVRTHLEGLSDSFTRDQLGNALTSAQNTGRVNTMLSGPTVALYASEQMDANTCKPCQQVNGKWLGNTDDPDIRAKIDAVYPNGGYVDCLGGARCRGTVVSVYRPETV